MSILDLHGDDVMAAASRYIKPPTVGPEPSFSVWSTITAPVRGIGEAVAQVGASAAEVVAGFGDVMGRIEAGESLSERQPDMQSDFADALRDRGREFRPDAQTAHAAEQVLYGFARGASKVVAGAMLAGPAGAVAAGVEEAMSVSDDLARDGVDDFATRNAAAAVQGAGLSLAALPLIGTTLKQTAGLYLIGGPGGFVAQQALTREILRNGGFDQIAEQYDPFDPVGLAVSALLPAVFTAAGIRGQRRQAAIQREVVDAARVALDVEQRQTSNPDPAPTMRSADEHETALVRAEEQMAGGEPVQVADVAPRAVITGAEREANFREWFGDSKVVDEAGAPLVVYHGTAGDFDAFDIRKAGAAIDAGKLGEGFYFTQDPRWASRYAENAAKADGAPSVAAVHVSLKNPLVLDGGGDLWSRLRSISKEWGIDADPVKDAGNTPNPLWSRRFTQEAMTRGHDGVILPSRIGQTEYVAFSAGQVKSATGNSGRFDPNSASLTDPLADFGAAVRELSAALDEVRGRTPEAATPARGDATTPADTAAAPTGNARDLRAEVIALRKSESVLRKLMECMA